MLNTLENLFKLARERKNNPIDGSYTNKLLSDKILSKNKIIEEINELIEAVEKNTNNFCNISKNIFLCFSRCLFIAKKMQKIIFFSFYLKQ